MNIQNKLIKIVFTSFFATIMFILGMTSLGFIPIGIFKITLLHIPVIISTIILGKKCGLFISLIFGFMSLINNTLYPSITSFIFSPFLNLDKGVLEVLKSIIICFIPRMFIVYSVNYTYTFLKKNIINKKIVLLITSIVGTFTNTFLVILGIYCFFWEKYINIFRISSYILPKVLIYSIILNCIFETIISIIFVLTIVDIIEKYFIMKGYIKHNECK